MNPFPNESLSKLAAFMLPAWRASQTRNEMTDDREY
jgi:hypothetical protein